MKYIGLPANMWMLFHRSFERGLIKDLGLDKAAARRVIMRAKARYREIVRDLPEFERGDRFAGNIVSCAMLCSVVLCMPERPSVEAATAYYRDAMMTAPMRWFCRRSAKSKFSDKDIASMKATSALRAADRNPYSWNMEYRPYSDGSGYEARFTHCGICTLMRELGLFDLVPAMCALDYAMSEAGGRSLFAREHTLAEGGPYCDCGYKRRQ